MPLSTLPLLLPLLLLLLIFNTSIVAQHANTLCSNLVLLTPTLPPCPTPTPQASEAYVEYDAAGRVLRGQEVKAKSRYEEDVMVNNHTAVWGSWWNDGAW